MMHLVQAVTLEPEGSQTRQRILGHDRPQDLMRVVAAVIGFAVLDRLITASSRLGAGDGEQAVLATAALTRNWAPTLALVVVVTAVAVLGGPRVRAGWSAMDHGHVWRWLTIPWVATAAWYWAAYDFNFLLGQWHALDRILIIALAGAAIAHPLFLVPFALQTEIVASQVLLTFGGATTQGADRLIMVAIIAIATTFLLVIASDTRDSSPGILLLGMAVAAHFFIPGRGKIAIDWLTTTELYQFAYSSYTTGWRADGDGSWASSIASFMRTVHWPLLIGTLAVELGAAIAVFHRLLLRWWLLAAILLHASIFLVSGFWLFGWFVVELGLLVILWRRDLLAWTSRNDTPARGAIAVIVVVGFGSWVFSPPPLAWLDAPISYGYEIEAVGASGTDYHVPLDDLGLAQQDLVFLFALYADRPPAVAGYGATTGVGFYALLGEVETFTQLRELEQTFTPVSQATRETSERLIVAWVDHVNTSGDAPWFMITPPSRFWVDRPEPTFDHNEPISSVDVVLVRSLHGRDGQRFDRETVLRVEVGADGRAAVTRRSEEPTDD